MIYRNLLLGLAGAVLIASSTVAQEVDVVFDFENQNAWQAAPNQTITSDGVDYQVTTSSRVFGIHRNGDTSENQEWQDGFIFLFGTVGGEEQGTMDFNTNGTSVAVRIHSIDIGSVAEDNTLVEGLLEGDVIWTITPSELFEVSESGVTNFPTFTESDTGDMTGAIDQIRWTCSGNNWTERMNDIAIEVVPAVRTQEKIYDWGLGSYWTPHSVYPGGFAPLENTLYWWSGYQSTNDEKVITHRPGLMDLPEGGGFHTDEYPDLATDTLVGGLGTRGYVYTNTPVRVLTTNESLYSEFDWKLYVNGSEDQRVMDMFFSTSDSTAMQVMGTSGNEIGFVLNQSSGDDTLRIMLDPADPYGISSAPALSVPLADLGINTASDLEGDDLHITYRAKKTSVANTWQCTFSISNKATMAAFSVDNVSVENAAAFDSTTYFCVSTLGDLSNGDTTSGANTAGYDIDNLNVKILMNPPPEPEGYEAYVVKHGLVPGDENTGLYEDYDNDMALNIYEYGWNGDMNNSADQGVLPTLVVSNGVSYYTILELKDPLSGISYSVRTTDDLVNADPMEPTWDSTTSVIYDSFYDAVTRGLNTTDVQFFDCVITSDEL